MGDRLKGKVAVVTGAGRGIGRAEALAAFRLGGGVGRIELRPGQDVADNGGDIVAVGPGAHEANIGYRVPAAGPCHEGCQFLLGQG